MTIRISRQQERQLLDWAIEAGDSECCGLICEADGVVTIELAANVAADPERHFEIDPAALIAAEKAHRTGQRRLLGIFHSHPNGLARPSEEDAAMAAEDGRAWLIIAGGRITAWSKSSSVGFAPIEL